MAGIKETKEVLSFILSLANALDISLQDGKVGISDLMHFLTVVKKAPAAFENLNMMLTEIVDLDAGERAELLVFTKKEFDITNDHLEKTMEHALDVAARLYELICEIRKS